MTVKPFRDDLGWKWKAYAGRWLLVTDGGGEQVILSAKHHSALQTRDLASGVLRDISPSDQVAKTIAAAADVRRHAQALMTGIHLGLIRIENIAFPAGSHLSGLLPHSQLGAASSGIGGALDKELVAILGGLKIALAKGGA